MAPDLTIAEQRNLRLFAHPLKVAAHRLGVHQATIKLHRRAIIRKLGAANHASACIIATQLGLWIEPQRKTT